MTEGPVRIVLTRPTGTAEGTARRLEQEGFEVIRMPLQTIVANPRARLAAALAQRPDWVIFTSPAAIEHGVAQHAGPWPPVGAVGPGTAARLRAAGLQVALQPERGQGAEALLATPQMQDVRGARLVVIGGSGGRRLLQTRLRGRGAHVIKVPVYRRVPVAVDADRFRQSLVNDPVIVFTSGETVLLWADLARRHRCPQALRLPLVAPSGRVVQQAARLGFSQRPWLLDGMRETDIAQLIRQRCAR